MNHIAKNLKRNTTVMLYENNMLLLDDQTMIVTPVTTALATTEPKLIDQIKLKKIISLTGNQFDPSEWRHANEHKLAHESGYTIELIDRGNADAKQDHNILNLQIRYNEYKEIIKASTETATAPFQLPKLSFADLEWLSLSAAKTDVRYYLNGLHYDPVNNCYVTTDGHRLHKVDATTPATANAQDLESIIIPHSTITALLQCKPSKRLLKNTTSIELDIYTDQRDEQQPNTPALAITNIDDSIIVSKMIAGKYPDYKRVLDGATTDNTLRAYHSELTQAAKAIVKITNNMSYMVFRKKDDAVTVSLNKVQDEGGIGFETTINAVWDDAENEQAFQLNARYLLDALTSLKLTANPTVTVQCPVNDGPALIRDNNHTAVVMPARL